MAQWEYKKLEVLPNDELLTREHLEKYGWIQDTRQEVYNKSSRIEGRSDGNYSVTETMHYISMVFKRDKSAPDYAEMVAREAEATRAREAEAARVKQLAQDFLIKDNILVTYRGSDRNVTIPSGVTSIGYEAFKECKSIASVIIPFGVTSIGNMAFQLCENLTSVTIPSSVTSIGWAAFYGCESLTSVTIPSGIISIERNVFRDCKSLTSIEIPASVTSIKKSAFAGCKKLGQASQNAIRQRFGDKPLKGGCYIATAVYGSYDCPQVWTLRRYRDFTLAESLFGRVFIHVYYAVSPTVVKWLGEKQWFNRLWRGILDRKIKNLRNRGVDDSPYDDRN